MLILASGASFHNFEYFFARDARVREHPHGAAAVCGAVRAESVEARAEPMAFVASQMLSGEVLSGFPPSKASDMEHHNALRLNLQGRVDPK